MRVLIVSTFLYLLGVVGILYTKPSFMFDKSGNWKEFAFKNTENHTWFPFWLFCIIWSVFSFFIVSFFLGSKSNSVNIKAPNDSTYTMQPGYYMLDKQASKKEGFPKYVYLGTDNPEE
jgi:hypothetical protein